MAKPTNQTRFAAKAARPPGHKPGLEKKVPSGRALTLPAQTQIGAFGKVFIWAVTRVAMFIRIYRP